MVIVELTICFSLIGSSDGYAPFSVLNKTEVGPSSGITLADSICELSRSSILSFSLFFFLLDGERKRDESKFVNGKNSAKGDGQRSSCLCSSSYLQVCDPTSLKRGPFMTCCPDACGML